MQSRTTMAPSEFFEGLRSLRRGLSVASVLYVSGLGAMVTTVLSSSMVLTVVVAVVMAVLCSAVAYRFGMRSEATYRESLGGDVRASCASEGSTNSCGNESCKGAGGTCFDRFEQELSFRIMVREQRQLASIVRGNLVLQGGVTFVWPLLTLLGLALGRLALANASLSILLELAGGLGFLLVRRHVKKLAGATADGGLWSDLP